RCGVAGARGRARMNAQAPLESRLRRAVRELQAARSRHDAPVAPPPAGAARTREAAVLVPFVRRDDALSVLFTRRAAHLRHHPGQISFPGGGVERQDADTVAAALRETFE